MDVKPESGESSPRRRLWAAAESLIAGALVIGANVLDAVPVSQTPWLVLLGWLSLRLRGLGWKTVGLRRPGSWVATTAVALTAGVALQLISGFVTEPIIERLAGLRREGSELAAMEKATVPEPLPEAPAVMVTHGGLLAAVQAQPAAAVTFTVPSPPSAGTDCPAGETE